MGSGATFRCALCASALASASAFAPQLRPQLRSGIAVGQISVAQPSRPPLPAVRCAVIRLQLSQLGRASRTLAFLASRPRGVVTGVFVALLLLAAYVLRDQGSDGASATTTKPAPDAEPAPAPAESAAAPVDNSRWTEQALSRAMERNKKTPLTTKTSQAPVPAPRAPPAPPAAPKVTPSLVVALPSPASPRAPAPPPPAPPSSTPAQPTPAQPTFAPPPLPAPASTPAVSPPSVYAPFDPTPAAAAVTGSSTAHAKIPLSGFFESPLMKKWEKLVDEEMARSRAYARK